MSEQPEFVCSICFSRLKGLDSMRSHLNHHARNAPPCLVCGQNYQRNSDLNKHYLKQHDILRMDIDPLVDADKVHASTILVTSDSRVMSATKNSVAGRSTRISNSILENNLRKLQDEARQPRGPNTVSKTRSDAAKLRSILIPVPGAKKRTSADFKKPSGKKRTEAPRPVVSALVDPASRVRTTPRLPGPNSARIQNFTANCYTSSILRNFLQPRTQVSNTVDVETTLPDLDTPLCPLSPEGPSPPPMDSDLPTDILCCICGVTQDIGCEHFQETTPEYGLVGPQSVTDSTSSSQTDQGDLESYTTSLSDLFEELQSWNSTPKWQLI